MFTRRDRTTGSTGCLAPRRERLTPEAQPVPPDSITWGVLPSSRLGKLMVPEFIGKPEPPMGDGTVNVAAGLAMRQLFMCAGPNDYLHKSAGANMAGPSCVDGIAADGSADSTPLYARLQADFAASRADGSSSLFEYVPPAIGSGVAPEFGPYLPNAPGGNLTFVEFTIPLPKDMS